MGPSTGTLTSLRFGQGTLPAWAQGKHRNTDGGLLNWTAAVGL
ncbi:hypothetical protein [Arthrobacter sp. Z1-9]